MAKTEESIKETIRRYIIKEYLAGEDEGIANDTPLISGGIVDSFSMVALKRFLERKYHINISVAEASPKAFDTVDGISALVQRSRARKR